MKGFAQLYQRIDDSNRTTDKVAAMVGFFREATTEDAAWAVNFLIGRRPKRVVNSTQMAVLAAELAGIPNWLYQECYDSVGDSAETIALLLPEPERSSGNHSLTWWVKNRLLQLAKLEEAERLESLRQSWSELDAGERFVFNKLITGSFRVGVSQELVTRALSQAFGIPAPVLAHRLMGDWEPSEAWFQALTSPDAADAQGGRPYPFCLAHPLETSVSDLGDRREWQIEWKWDGIRSQVIHRSEECFVWSRGEELITERFPEIAKVAAALPDGTVLDGEILGWKDELPLKFLDLQRRIGRKTVSKKLLLEVPVVLVAFDLLEEAGTDLRDQPLSDRRHRLEQLVSSLQKENPDLPIRVSPSVEVGTWEEATEVRHESRTRNAEGYMLKRLSSAYEVGRKRGNWWKWKIDPLTVDAVVIYAQRGTGKRAAVHSDYTFGLWDAEGNLVPFAKAYSGLTDAEIAEVDRWIRRNTLEKFGPVRTVKAELVMELAFEGIQRSNRHKSGLAVRFPRILRWRHDKGPQDADTLENVYRLLETLE